MLKGDGTTDIRRGEDPSPSYIRSISMHFRGRVSKLRWDIERYIRLNELSLGPIKPTPEIPAMGTV